MTRLSSRGVSASFSGNTLQSPPSAVGVTRGTNWGEGASKLTFNTQTQRGQKENKRQVYRKLFNTLLCQGKVSS